MATEAKGRNGKSQKAAGRRVKLLAITHEYHGDRWLENYAATRKQAGEYIKTDEIHAGEKDRRAREVVVTFPGTIFTVVDICRGLGGWKGKHPLDVPPVEVLADGGRFGEMHFDAGESPYVPREEALKMVAEYNLRQLDNDDRDYSTRNWRVALEVGNNAHWFFNALSLTGAAGTVAYHQDLPVRVIHPTADERREIGRAVKGGDA